MEINKDMSVMKKIERRRLRARLNFWIQISTVKLPVEAMREAWVEETVHLQWSGTLIRSSRGKI